MKKSILFFSILIGIILLASNLEYKLDVQMDIKFNQVIHQDTIIKPIYGFKNDRLTIVDYEVEYKQIDKKLWK